MDNNNKRNKENQSNKKKPKKYSFIFLGIVIIIYIILGSVNSNNTFEAIKYSINLFKTLIPVLSLVLVFMFLFNLIDEKKLKGVIEKSPHSIQYFIMTLLGTVSHGPIYAWYPLMKTFHGKGVSYGPIASFLYSRGIKLAMLPSLVAYFGLKYTIILTSNMIIFAIIMGLSVDLLIKDNKLEITK